MFAFVLMPFDPVFDDVYRLGIKEPAEKLGIRAERVDEQIFHKEDILQRIYNQIIAADFIIADMTGRNPNVFYETGYAHAKEKTCLLLTSNADDIPFDLKHHRHIVYGKSIQNLRQQVENDLTVIKADVATRKAALVIKVANAFGDLKKINNLWADGELSLSLDLHNHTNSGSPEIEALYLYTGKDWGFSQDGSDCASTESDIPEFNRRHFIKPPVRRLTAKAWAQIRLKGTATLAWLNEGEQFKSKYRVTGRLLVRCMTSEGPFDFPLSLDVTFEEFPF